jgi:hypothetical protein
MSFTRFYKQLTRLHGNRTDLCKENFNIFLLTLKPEKMKKLLCCLILITVFSVKNMPAQQVAQNSVETKKEKVNGPVASFDQTAFDMGEIEQKVPKTATFVLKNDGNEPLIIASAQASCGCTNLQYDKVPIMPGKSTNISATYNAANPGNFTKSVTVRTNASDQPVVLTIKGNVVEKK